MRLLALAALVAGTILPAVPQAHGACAVCDEQGCPRVEEDCTSRSRYYGGCHFLTAARPGLADEEHHTGVLYVATVVYSTANPTDNPVSATVSCELRINGAVTRTSNAYSGTTVIAGVEPLQFTANLFDFVELCEIVDFTSDDTPTAHLCWHDPELLFDEVFDTVDDLFVHGVDPVVCPVLAEHFPPEGDVPYPADLGTFWDCPPYGN